MNPLSLLGGIGSLGGIAAVLGLLTTLGAGAAYVVHEHDARIVAEVASTQAVAAASAQAQDNKRTIANLILANNQAQDRLNALGKLKEAINAAPVTSTCLAAPSVRALVVGLRNRAGSGNTGAAPTPATANVAVPARTAATH